MLLRRVNTKWNILCPLSMKLRNTAQWNKTRKWYIAFFIKLYRIYLRCLAWLTVLCTFDMLATIIFHLIICTDIETNPMVREPLMNPMSIWNPIFHVWVPIMKINHSWNLIFLFNGNAFQVERYLYIVMVPWKQGYFSDIYPWSQWFYKIIFPNKIFEWIKYN